MDSGTEYDEIVCKKGIVGEIRNVAQYGAGLGKEGEIGDFSRVLKKIPKPKVPLLAIV